MARLWMRRGVGPSSKESLLILSFFSLDESSSQEWDSFTKPSGIQVNKKVSFSILASSIAFSDSNFHLLGVGAEKSSLYRLGFLGFDVYLIIMKRGRFDKGAFQPFCWIVGPQPRPIEWIRRGLPMTEPLLYYSLPHPLVT